MKYAVHARWLAVPASLDPTVAGTRQHGEKQEKKSDGKPETDGYFHALDMVLIGYPLDQHGGHMLRHGFCMASERGRLFLISLHPDLRVMARWHRPLLAAGT